MELMRMNWPLPSVSRSLCPGLPVVFAVDLPPLFPSPWSAPDGCISAWELPALWSGLSNCQRQQKNKAVRNMEPLEPFKRLTRTNSMQAHKSLFSFHSEPLINAVWVVFSFTICSYVYVFLRIRVCHTTCSCYIYLTWSNLPSDEWCIGKIQHHFSIKKYKIQK